MTESVTGLERQRDELAGTGALWQLWFGLLGGPIAGMLMVWVNYPLVDRACITGNRVWLHAASALFLCIALSAWLVSRRFYRDVGDVPLSDGGALPRTGFMALVGMLAGGLAMIEIFFQWIPVFLLRSCVGT